MRISLVQKRAQHLFRFWRQLCHIFTFYQAKVQSNVEIRPQVDKLVECGVIVRNADINSNKVRPVLKGQKKGL